MPSAKRSAPLTAFSTLIFACALAQPALATTASCTITNGGTCEVSCDPTTQTPINDTCDGGPACCKAKPATTTPASGGLPTTFSKYTYQDPLGGVTIPQLVARIIAQVLPLVGALFFVMFVWGGFLWFSSNGDEGKLKKARQTLVNAVIGIVIVMGAYILVYNVIAALGKAIGQ